MNILTFDIEEWFHILDNDSTKTHKQWDNYEKRIHFNMDKILNLLDKNKLKATFFIVGWIAQKYPEIVRIKDMLECIAPFESSTKEEFEIHRKT